MIMHMMILKYILHTTVNMIMNEILCISKKDGMKEIKVLSIIPHDERQRINNNDDNMRVKLLPFRFMLNYLL